MKKKSQEYRLPPRVASLKVKWLTSALEVTYLRNGSYSDAKGKLIERDDNP